MTIKHDEASLRRSATDRFSKASEDLQKHTRESKVKGLLAGLIIVLLAIGTIAGARFLF